jgi:hypothetical protein
MLTLEEPVVGPALTGSVDREGSWARAPDAADVRQKRIAAVVSFIAKSDSFYSEISRIIRQGLPAANTPSGMSRVTTLPAPITDREPI